MGLTPPAWLLEMCARAVGNRQAERLMQQGLLLGAEEALRVGFVDEIVAHEQLLHSAVARAVALVALPSARAETKLMQREPVVALADSALAQLFGRASAGPNFRAL